MNLLLQSKYSDWVLLGTSFFIASLDRFLYTLLHFICCTLLQVEDIIREAQQQQKRVRVVGNALSPNGIGLSEDTMLSLGQCDRVLHVDQERKTVTIEVIKNSEPNEHQASLGRYNIP